MSTSSGSTDHSYVACHMTIILILFDYDILPTRQNITGSSRRSQLIFLKMSVSGELRTFITQYGSTVYIGMAIHGSPLVVYNYKEI